MLERVVPDGKPAILLSSIWKIILKQGGVWCRLECGFARTKIRKISFYEKVKVKRFSWSVKIN